MRILRVSSRAARAGLGSLGALALATATTALIVPATANATTSSTTYSFKTIDNKADTTFNQLLGINSSGKIAGYFGIGSASHPNKGYVVNPPYGQKNFVNENFPGSVQTQVTAINNKGDTAGFWVNSVGNSFGFVEWNGVFASFRDPNTPNVKGQVNQLLGINDSGIAVGFYMDSKGHAHGYTVNQSTRVFKPVKAPGTDITATGINDKGQIVGISTTSGSTSSFLLANGHLTAFQFPNGSSTSAFGINNSDQIVGSYVDSHSVMHGFVLSGVTGSHSKWQKVDDPKGIGSTTINGINSAGDLVGFYTDSGNNVDGFLATP